MIINGGTRCYHTPVAVIISDFAAHSKPLFAPEQGFLLKIHLFGNQFDSRERNCYPGCMTYTRKIITVICAAFTLLSAAPVQAQTPATPTTKAPTLTKMQEAFQGVQWATDKTCGEGFASPRLYAADAAGDAQ